MYVILSYCRPKNDLLASGLRSKSMAPQAGVPPPAKNSRSISRKQESVEDSDETAIMSKPIEKENKKPAGGVVG